MRADDSHEGRVLVLNPSDDSYGVDRVLIRIVDILRENGWDVSCVLEATNTGTGWLSRELQLRGVPVAPVRLANLTRRLLANPLLLFGWLLVALAALPRVARRARHADVVYINGFTLPIAALGGRLARKYVFWHLHEIPPGGRLLGSFIKLLSHRQICVSRAVADAFGLANAHSCVILHNAVEVPAKAVSQPDVSADSPLEIGIVARVNRGKGHLVLADAFRELLERDLPVRLHIVGAPHASDTSVMLELQQRLRALGPDYVVWAGEVRSGAEYMQRLHALAAPSIRPDPFPLSVLEGMAAGLAVVASDTGGHPEAITHDVSGLLCRPGDARDLAAQLHRIVEDVALRQSLAAAARNRVLEDFSPEAFETRLLRAIQGRH